MSTRSPGKIGRPRASGASPEGPVAENILNVARKLFRENGFAGTSTREIASAAGLRQPSLFHYFPNKEAIFKRVVLSTVEPILEFIATERAVKQLPEIALYRLVWHDTHNLCVHENSAGLLFMLPEIHPERMPELWTMRREIIDEYARLLRRGTKSGVFAVDNLQITTNLLFALGESTLGWYDKQGPAWARKTAHLVAGFALRSVLVDPAQMQDIRSKLQTSMLTPMLT